MQSDPAAQVLVGLRRIVRALRTTTSHAIDGVGGAQLFVLREVASEPGLSLKRLAERTLTDPSSVSVVVGKLVGRGLLTRGRSAEDARRHVLTLTRSGAAVLARAPEPLPSRLVSAMAAMPPAEVRALARSLARLVRAAGLESGHAPMFFEDPAPSSRGRRDA